MNETQKIKVIKKNTIGKHVRSEDEPKQPAARDLASTISAWVSELRVRKSNDAKIPIGRFFTQAPQSSGVVIRSAGSTP